MMVVSSACFTVELSKCLGVQSWLNIVSRRGWAHSPGGLRSLNDHWQEVWRSMHVPSLMDRLSFKIAVFIDLQKSNSKHPDWKRARPRTGRLYSRGLKPPITSSTARQWHREMSVQSPKDTKRQQPPSFSLITLPPSRKRCRSIRDHNTRLQSRSVPQAVRLFMS